MSYLIYAKWNLLCIHRRRFSNTQLFKKIRRPMVEWLWVGMNVAQFCLCYLLIGGMLEKPYIDMLSTYGGRVDNFLRNERLVKLLIVGYVLLVSVLIVIRVSRLVLSDKKEEFLCANYNLHDKGVILIKIINYVLYDSIETITFLFPIIAAFLRYWGKMDVGSVIKTILLLLLVIEVRIILTIMLCAYKEFKDSQNKHLIMVGVSLRNVVFFLMAEYVGSLFSRWLDKFPLVKRNVCAEEFETWLTEGEIIFSQGFQWWGRILVAAGQSVVNFTMLLFCVGPIALMLSAALFCRVRRIEKGHYGKNGVVFEKLRKKDLYYKAVLSEPSEMNGVNYLFTCVLFWVMTGAFTGMMTHIVHKKVIVFLCVSCAFYYSCYLAIANFSRNIRIYALDGEGKKIYYWLDDMSSLFWRKIKLWSISMISASMVEYLLMYVVLKRKELIAFFMLQSIYCIFLFFMLSIPGVLVPYYEYSNVRELEEYVDRKKVIEVIEFTLLVGVNSMMAIPAALYIGGYMAYKRYVIIQFFAIPILLSIAVVVAWIVIRRVIGSKEYLDKIYKG